MHLKKKNLKKSEFFFCISQNHQMVEVSRDLLRSSGPNTLLKQGHLEMVSKGYVQFGFEDLQWWRLHSLSGQSVPMFGLIQQNY